MHAHVPGPPNRLPHLNSRQLTRSSLSGPLVARMLSFCSSCAMRPQKRLKVRGSRTLGFTEMSWFLAVRMYTAWVGHGTRYRGQCCCLHSYHTVWFVTWVVL